MPETASSKYLDGAGVGYLWKQVKGYVDGNVENLSTPLPIPVCTVEPGSGSSAIIKLSNTFTGYGNVTVRYRLGAEPSASDSALDTASGTTVTAAGTYYIKAFPEEGSTFTESAALILEVTF